MMRKIIISFLLAGLLLLSSAPIAFAKPDKDKPTPATDIELVKKITLKGSQGRGGKPTAAAATGILGTQCAGDKYAIVVGISDYPGSASDLAYGDDDADLVTSTLINSFGFLQENIHTLKDSGANWQTIVDTIDSIKAVASSEDEVLFFFSGHGAKGKAADGDNENTDEAIVTHQDGQFAYLWDGDLKSLFSTFATTRITFIFDSCLSGGMTDLKGLGRVICMACSENGLSYESEYWGGGHGQFTYYFFKEGITDNLADKYDQVPNLPDVTIEEAFDYTKVYCVQQTPTISDSFVNDLLPSY